MDDVDRLLVNALRANGRATFAELARLVGLSAPAVHERVGKLETSGVITGYHAAIAPGALGNPMSALIGVFITDSADSDDIAEAIGGPHVGRGLLVRRGGGDVRGEGAVPTSPGSSASIRDLNSDQRRGPHPDDRRALDEVRGPLRRLGADG